MLHSRSSWMVCFAPDASTLAYKLTDSVWTCCQAFEPGGYVFANDATSPDGEYAVLRGRDEASDLVQIESITFSWCSEARACELINRVIAGQFDSDNYGTVARSRLQTAAEHQTYQHCA